MSDAAEKFEGLELDLDLKEFPVRLKNRKTGVVEEFTIREITGLERDKLLNLSVGKSNAQGRLNDFTNIQAHLISKCLHDADGKSVSIKVVEDYPAKVQKVLFKKCQEMNGLGEFAEDDAKKD